MPGAFKLHTLAIVVLAILFAFFFFTSKHDPSFGNINPSSEDPYDAIGSVGIQLALLTALLSVLRVFRPYPNNQAQESAKQLVIRLWSVCLLSIALTLMTDLIALLRYPSLWLESDGATSLILLFVSMTIPAALLSWSTYRLTRTIIKVPASTHRRESVLVLLLCILMLMLYPASWRQNVTGAIGTAAAGFVLLFLMTWSVTRGLFPIAINDYNDSLDDLDAVYQWLREHAGVTRGLFESVERIIKSPSLQLVVDWLNPRKHRWNLVIGVAVAVSVLLTFVELTTEGTSPDASNFWLLVMIFFGAEMFAILVGYALLAPYVGMFRDEAARH
jgi:hypothetical protein